MSDFIFKGSFFSENEVLFNDITLPIAEGQWTCLLGPSGCGKSTILRTLAGLKTFGEFSPGDGCSSLASLRGQVAYMAQSDLLFPWLDVLDNVNLGARLRGDTLAPDQAMELIRRVGLESHVHKTPGELSGGMRQRVALARTLMENRKLVLLDEPFSALDARTRAEMQELTFDMLRDCTVLLVPHDPAEAARMGHHIFMLDQSGLSYQAAAATSPIREIDDEQAIEVQINLFQRLRACR